MEYEVQTVTQFGSAGNSVRRVVVPKLAFRPDEALRHRAFGYQEPAGDFGGFQATEETERESDLGIGREGRVTAHEDQPELVVWYDVDEFVQDRILIGFHISVLDPESGEMAFVPG